MSEIQTGHAWQLNYLERHISQYNLLKVWQPHKALLLRPLQQVKLSAEMFWQDHFKEWHSFTCILITLKATYYISMLIIKLQLGYPIGLLLIQAG